MSSVNEKVAHDLREAVRAGDVTKAGVAFRIILSNDAMKGAYLAVGVSVMDAICDHVLDGLNRGPDETFTWKDILNGLAELIYPTTRIEDIEDHGGGERQYNTTCHNFVWCADDEPDFCPYCGARIVEDED